MKTKNSLRSFLTVPLPVALLCTPLLVTLVFAPRKAKSQTIDVQISEVLLLIGTNVNTNSLTLDGTVTRVVAAGDNPTNCGPEVTIGPTTLTMVENQWYDTYYGAIFCDVGSDSAIHFDGIPSCTHLWIGPEYEATLNT